MKDHECLLGWRRDRRAEALRPIVERYGPLVFSCAHKRLGDSGLAAEAARAAFLVLAHRRRRSAKLERWLLKITLVASRRIKKRSFSRLRERFERKLAPEEIMPLPQGLADEILSAIGAIGPKRSKEELTRWVLRKLFWARWRKRAAAGAFVMVVLGAVALKIEASRGYSEIIAQAILWSSRFDVSKHAEEVQPWTATLQATNLSSASKLFGTTNVWPVHLEFTRAQWEGLNPRRIAALPNFITPDGKFLLRNPKAPRSGLAGVMGYAFNWSGGDLEFGGVRFNKVGVRIKGNVGALIEPKRPFKVDLNRFVRPKARRARVGTRK